MTGMPWLCAFCVTWSAAPLRLTSNMTPQPLVNCWSAMVANFWVSFCAFWMSVSNPAFLNDDSSAGRSPFSHRLEESASGRITHARWAFAFPPLPPLALLSLLPPDPHAARASTLTAAAATPNFGTFTGPTPLGAGRRQRRHLATNVCVARHTSGSDWTGGFESVKPVSDFSGGPPGGSSRLPPRRGGRLPPPAGGGQ